MLKINQKVIMVSHDVASAACPGDIGYIVCRKPNEPNILGINFITGICTQEGHNLRGRLETDSGNWINQNCLEEYKEGDNHEGI